MRFLRHGRANEWALLLGKNRHSLLTAIHLPCHASENARWNHQEASTSPTNSAEEPKIETPGQPCRASLSRRDEVCGEVSRRSVGTYFFFLAAFFLVAFFLVAFFLAAFFFFLATLRPPN